MSWQDTGIVLTTRRLGEHDLLLGVLSRQHGRHAGVVKGGAGRRGRGLYQPGNQLALTWRARLEDHLGTFSAELTEARAAALFDRPGPLAGLAAACAVLAATLPERDPWPDIHDDLVRLLAALGDDNWAVAYVRWEASLLADLGFGLDLSACAVTGRTDDLAYVSPRTGRAVCREAAGPYRARLLPLPAFLLAEVPPGPGDLANGLALTAHFLAQHVLAPRPLPQPRAGLGQWLD
nr:DNA repair protein RecO [Roseospirillum parvum]